MRTAIYARVSTKDRGQDVENQLAQLRAFVATQGWTITAEFIDTVTGGTSDRPEFQKMFSAAEKKEFDCLLFWSLDRLSREGVLATLNHLNRLESYGVSYRSFTEQYLDSCGLFKDAIIGIMATLAKQEKIRISERTKAGLERTRANGTQLGRRPMKIDLRKLAELRAAGMSERDCAKQLNCSEFALRSRRAA
jgi:DNA invertase Pin-like site-specific DNA recombinase